MRRFLAAFAILFLPLIHAPQAHALLSANDNRLARMIDACEAELQLTNAECGCIFRQSFQTNLSNVDISFYFGNQPDKLSSEAKATLDRLAKMCRGQGAADNAPDAAGPYARLQELCVAKDNMDAPRCGCLFRRSAAKGYADSDVEWFLKGRASKLSDFSVYTAITIDLLECEKEVIQSQ